MVNLPQRKNLRLKEYDYSSNGAYFITICTKDRHEMLWKNVGARVLPFGYSARTCQTPQLSEYGIVINRTIHQISEHYPCVVVDKYVIMPNHIHMILILLNEGGRAMRAPTISTVINQMKGHITKEIGFSLWQKLFHDRIIRNEQEYLKIWEYIDTNPMKWEEDCFYEKPVATNLQTIE